MKLSKFTTLSGYARLVVGVVIVIGFSTMGSGSVAQSQRITLTETAEHNIGFRCPLAATFNADFTRLWVLQSGKYGCAIAFHSLQAFEIQDWSPVLPDTGAFGEQLAILAGSAITDSSAMAFTSDDTLDIRYISKNINKNFSLAIINGTVNASQDTFILSEETLGTLISDSTYPEFAIYNANHTLAAVPSDTTWYIVDMNARTLLFDVPNSGTVRFSSDGTTLYVTELNNPDDPSDYSATLVSYSLPDGERSDKSIPVPSFILWVSPDHTRAAVLLGENGDALVVVDLTSGEISAPVDVFEAPQRVLNCQNRKGDMRDLNFMSSGELPIMSLNWLPDSSGFVTVNTYNGDGSSGGVNFCAWDFSRLREYRVETGT